MRGSLALLFLAAFLGEAAAQASSKVERIDIVEYGIYLAQTAVIENAPATATGQRNILSDTRLIAATTRIEAKIGVHFGMRYLLLGQPNSATVRLTSVTNYPVPGLKKPGTETHQARGEHPLFATIGAINYRGYVFEQDWELVPGNWTFELWDGKRKLVSQTFQVVKP
jgi:Domain of unknown function (DUF3859)